MNLRRRESLLDGTELWAWSFRVRRWQLGVTLIKHTYPLSSDRWVLQPEIVYDRK